MTTFLQGTCPHCFEDLADGSHQHCPGAPDFLGFCESCGQHPLDDHGTGCPADPAIRWFCRWCGSHLAEHLDAGLCTGPEALVPLDGRR